MIIMPKQYDKEKLREEALKLRAEGLSYRQIAERLGCSTYIVSQVLSEYEKERKKKIGEMTVELEKRVDKFKISINMQKITSNIYAI